MIKEIDELSVFRIELYEFRITCQVEFGVKMALDKLLDFLTPDEPLPNKFTIYMGEKIREGRMEMGISQQELARRVYKRQAALSDYENGRAVVNSDTLSLIAVIFNKPLEYFYPHYAYWRTTENELSPYEDELIKTVRYHIADKHFMKLLIEIVKSMGKFDIDHFVVEQYETSKNILDDEEAIDREARKRKRKK